MMYGYGFQDNNGYRMMGGYFNNGYGFIIPLILIIIIVYALYKLFSYRTHSNYESNNSLNILKSKYVQGEISEDDYLRKKDILTRK